MALASAISLGTLRRQRAGQPGRGTPVAVDGRGRTWTGSFERALFVVFGLIVVNDVAVSMQWLSQAFGVSGGIGRAAIVVAVGALGCSAVLILFGFLGPALVYLTVGAVAGAQLVFVWAEPDASALPGTWWAWQLMIPTSILVCAGLPLSRAAPALAVLLTGYAGLRLSPGTGPGHGPQATISDLSCFVLFAVMVLVTVRAWRRTAEMSDEATLSRNRSHAATESARAGDRQRRAVARLLHDEVIHALRAVALTPGAIDPVMVRDLTGRACTVLAEGSSALANASIGDLRAVLEELAARSPLIVRVEVRGEPALPEPVAAAITAAVGEALRNVQRHSGVIDAVIEARSLAGGVHVRVTDEGRGFDPGLVTGPLGYRSSILERVADVGGTATVTSALGSGTTVAITWEIAPEMSRDASRRLADLAGTRMRLITGGVAPMMVFALIQGGLNSARLVDPVAALLAVSGAAVITLGALLWSRGRSMPGWMSIALIVTALTTTVAGGWELRAAGDVELAYFAAGAGGPALALVAFFRPTWESITGATVVTAAAAEMVHRMDPGWPAMEQALPAVMSTLIAIAGVLAARITIDRMSRNVLWAEEMERQAGTVRAQLDIGRRVMADRLGRVQAWVLPFLTGVARGDLQPADPTVRRQAAVLEAAVRDDIRLGACLDEAARGLIAGARATGRLVEINADPEVAGLLPAGLISRLFTAALDRPEGPPDRTVLTMSQVEPREVSVSLLVAPPPIDHALASVGASIGATIVAGPTFQLVRLTASRTSPLVGSIPQPADPVGSIR